MNAAESYCIDTSSLLEAWVRSYRPANFPSFWRNLEQLIADGRCVICEEVKTEVDRGSGGLSHWLKSQPRIVSAFDRDQELMVRDVMSKFPKIVNIKKGKGAADPFVIALAYCKGHIVVTEEGPGAIEGPKIPFVCKAYGIKCITLVEMIEREDWVF